MATAALTFRDATPADVEAIVALVESAYRGESSRAGWTTEADLLDGHRTDQDAVVAAVTGPRSTMILARRGGQALVACCQLEQRANAVCYFGMFAVQPLLQGDGVGRRVLAEAERVARDEHGARTMEMTVIAQREELIAWYLRRGYTPTGETLPFPYGDERFGLPRRDDLVFTVLAKPLVPRQTRTRWRIAWRVRP